MAEDFDVVLGFRIHLKLKNLLRQPCWLSRTRAIMLESFAKAMGYQRLVTYTQADEPGTSLRAAGWHVVAVRAPRKSWYESSSSLQNQRAKRHDLPTGGVQRLLWEVIP